MQITFNVPDALQRALDWLAAKQNANADALMYITAYQGFEKELRRKVSDAMRHEEAEKPYRTQPAPIDWHKLDRPTPINWKGDTQGTCTFRSCCSALYGSPRSWP